MEYSLQHHKSFIGLPISSLPTPSLVVSKPVVERNIAQLHRDVETTGLAFRPHVKTLKTLEATRLMLGNKYKKIVASTLAEIRGIVPLAEEGVIEEVLYGLPIRPSALPELAELRKTVRIILMIDHAQHLDLIEEFVATSPSESPQRSWDVFIKLDVGSRRAGVPTSSQRLNDLVQRTLGTASSAVSLYGFYCHAGHSYGSRTRAEAEAALQAEVSAVAAAASLVPASHTLTVSIGATPTAHVVSSLQRAPWGANVTLELHAGNFPANDLQQVSTGLVAAAQQAVRVVTEVCGVYPERGEALVNAGTIALSKETAGLFPGFGSVVGKPGWIVARMSQEHGILAWDAGAAAAMEAAGGLAAAAVTTTTTTTTTTISSGAAKSVEDEFRIGDKVLLYCAHACITAAAFHVYYVVDENDIVRETWVPWKGW
ncbi:alanine racemase domain-containing protein [Niveomyces insectorum RCEF 264]|uniref:D-serine dehydratase n=1 Tax=Niveomyces insectorum RCEF 264 TaxID=1081102 RepID=A0A167XB07_9HYPO|nr:alanine racemase domain-containing protein [Niveomyces insectorum RCEF 264]